VPLRVEALRFLRQDRQRGLEAVRQIARLGERAAYPLLAVVEQSIEVAHERLDLRRVFAFHARRAPAAHLRQARAQATQWRQAALHLGERQSQDPDRHEPDEAPVHDAHGKRAAADHHEGDVVHDQSDPDRPQDGAEDDARAQRAELHAPPIR
jgi:hypothetical protein